jgi:hypothetical protein
MNLVVEPTRRLRENRHGTKLSEVFVEGERLLDAKALHHDSATT